jgi:hypothetical protein
MDMAVTVYQLKVVLRDVQPPVWRRVLLPADATIRTLHETVQVVMGWTNCHLHQFIIHGKEYGVAYEGGIPFADPPDKVRLAGFGFRPHEKFEYVYDLGDCWEHELTVEKILALDPARIYPVCIGGAQPCPPEDCGGPWRYSSVRRTRTPRRGQRKGRSLRKAKDPEDAFDLDSVNLLLRDRQSGWLRRFDEGQ